MKWGGNRENDKPSSVSLMGGLFDRSTREDGHLSRILIAQDLKRPYPPRLSPDGEIWTGLPHPFRGTGPIWSCSGWGLPGHPDRSRCGEPLPRLFTLTLSANASRAVSFLWHFPYPVKQPLRLLHRTVRVTDHPALWSSDFPPLGRAEERPSALFDPPLPSCSVPSGW